jgi:hypothetical protein
MRTALAAIVCLVLVPAVAGADLVITQDLSTSGFMGMWSSEGTEVTYLKGERMRTESEMTTKGMMPGMKQGQVSRMVVITRFDEGISWVLDTEARTYSEMSLTYEEMAGEFGKGDAKVRDVKVQKTDQQREIAGYKCQGIRVDMVLEVPTGKDKMSHTAQMMFWVALEAKDLQEMDKLWDRMFETFKSSEVPMKEAMEEMSEKLAQYGRVFLGMDIAMEMPKGEEDAEMEQAMKMMKQYMKDQEGEDAEEAGDGRMTITREVTSISKEKLDGALFEIPDGYKKIKVRVPKSPKQATP